MPRKPSIFAATPPAGHRRKSRCHSARWPATQPGATHRPRLANAGSRWTSVLRGTPHPKRGRPPCGGLPVACGGSVGGCAPHLVAARGHGTVGAGGWLDGRCIRCRRWRWWRRCGWQRIGSSGFDRGGRGVGGRCRRFFRLLARSQGSGQHDGQQYPFDALHEGSPCKVMTRDGAFPPLRRTGISCGASHSCTRSKLATTCRDAGHRAVSLRDRNPGRPAAPSSAHPCAADPGTGRCVHRSDRSRPCRAP